MKVYVIWIEFDSEDNPEDQFKIQKVVTSEDAACIWCSDYNENHGGHSSAYYDEFYLEEKE